MLTLRPLPPLAILLLGACATQPPRAALAPVPGAAMPRATAVSVLPPGQDVVAALSQRVVALKARGGTCQEVGKVLDHALSAGRLEVRPYMWRVGGRLASAQARSTGEIAVARDVDSLNVGLRTLDEVVHSVEHEAVHITFAIPSGPWNEGIVDERVGACRSNSEFGVRNGN